MNLKLITPPAVEPITLAEAKAHIRTDDSMGTAEDAAIQAYIAAAREYCESAQRRAYIEQTFELALDAFADSVELPRPPLLVVESVKYYDADNREYTMQPTSYTVDTYKEPGLLLTNYIPAVTLRPSSGVIIRYRAGFAPLLVVQDHTGEALGTGDGTEDTFYLPGAPIISGSATVYIDGTSVLPANYLLNELTGEIVFTAPPLLDEVITADYRVEALAPAGSIPEKVKQAIKMLTAHYYDTRETFAVGAGNSGVTIPFAVDALLGLDKVML